MFSYALSTSCWYREGKACWAIIRRVCNDKTMNGVDDSNSRQAIVILHIFCEKTSFVGLISEAQRS